MFVNMENYESSYNSVCRLCLCQSHKETMAPLFEDTAENELTHYAKSLINVTRIPIKKGDSLPPNICVTCLGLLKQAVYFKIMCETSYKRLQKLVEISSTTDGDFRENLKEKVVQYVLFTQYFPISSSFQDRSEPQSIDGFKAKNDKNECNKVDNLNDFSVDITEQKSHEDLILDAIERNIEATYNAPSRMDISKKIKLQVRKLRKFEKLPSIKRVKVDNYTCNICLKVLSSETSYKNHMQRHSGCRYICEQCGKGFPIFYELKRHQVFKHGTGSCLQCQYCKFKAPRKFELIEHERLHTGERPFTCDKCGLTFRRRAIWHRHLKHHSEKDIQCPHCPHRFHRKGDMLAHANNIHERVYLFVCNHCDVKYTKITTVRRHMTQQHGVPREKQGKITRIIIKQVKTKSSD